MARDQARRAAKEIAAALKTTLERGAWMQKMTVSIVSQFEISTRVFVAELEKTHAFPKVEFTARTTPNFQGGTTVLVTRHKL